MYLLSKQTNTWVYRTFKYKLFSVSCFVIDSSGFVIIHPTYLANPPAQVDHVTTKEPHIATDLVSNNIMISDVCANYVDISMQLFWKVHSYIFL